MKRFLVVFSAFMLLLGLSGAAGAYSINYVTLPVGNEFTSVYASLPGFVTQNFNGSTLGSLPGLPWTWTGDGAVVDFSSSGLYAAPAGVSGVPDASKYVTVPDTTNTDVTNKLTATLGGNYNYIGLWWGSVDPYNSLDFYSGGSNVMTITGTQAIAPYIAAGNQSSATNNLYVNIYGLPSFDSFSMTSTQNAFEADNITVGVPEPGTLLLLGSGLLGLALAGSRKKFRK